MTNNNNDNNNKNKKRSIFTEVDEREKRLEAKRKKADFDRANALTTENARDVAAMLLVNALRQEFQKVDKLQGGSFIHGSMQRLNTSMWKGLTDNRKK